MVRLVETIASNATGLYSAREIIPGRLPVAADNGGQPIQWNEKEPNDYSDFGSQTTLIARTPINSDRQRKKGTPVGRSSSAGFTSDLTATNAVEDMEEFLFAAARRKSRLFTTGVALDGYTVAAGGSAYTAGTLVFAKGHTVIANNGLRVVTGGSAADKVSVAGVFVDASDGEISRVGFQFSAGDLAIDLSALLPALVSATVDFEDLGIIPGEILYLGDAGHNFAGATNRGYIRALAVEGNTLTLDKTDATFVAEVCAGTARLFFGTVIKNEKSDLQQTYTKSLRRLLGRHDLDSAVTQSEVVTRCVANELKISIPEEDKITLDLSYIAGDHMLFTDDATEVGGVFVPVEEEDAINTTKDSVRASMIVYPAGGNDSAPLPIFAVFTNIDLTINNNVNENKAITRFGAFAITPGFFEVSGAFDAYFATVEGLRAVRDSEDASFMFAGWKDRKGFAIDMPMVALSTNGLTVAVNEPVTLSVDGQAATGRKYNLALDHTVLFVFFDYLPAQAAV